MKTLNKLSGHNFSRYFKLLFVVWDLVLLNISILLSGVAGLGGIDKLFLTQVQTVSLLSNLVWITLLLYNDSFRIVRVEPIESILKRTIKKIAIHSAFITIFVVFLNYIRALAR